MELALVGRLLAASVVIALVLAGMHFAVRGLRRSTLAPSARSRLTSLVESTYLPAGASVHVVRVMDRYLVIGRHAGALVTLAELPHADVDGWLRSQAGSRTSFEPFATVARRLAGGG
ncbi:MAG: hypothetical protein NVS2B3_06720 [Vulcanimicrobiaceae bacterium]